MSEKKDTRSAILDEAQDLVQRQSLSGVSFQELAKRVGIKKGSMYYHFETKDDLTVELMSRTEEKLRTGFKNGLTMAPLERLSNFFSYYRSTASMCNKICFGGAFAGEWETLSPAVRDSVKNALATMTNGVADIIQDGVNDGVFQNHDREARELAVWVVSNLQGALITARVFEEVDPYDSMVDLITNYLTVEG